MNEVTRLQTKLFIYGEKQTTSFKKVKVRIAVPTFKPDSI